MALCGIMFAVQSVSAQQTLLAESDTAQQILLVEGDSGIVNIVNFPSVKYATYNLKPEWFYIYRESLLYMDCPKPRVVLFVQLASNIDVKTVSVPFEVGICSSQTNPNPNYFDDQHIKTGTEFGRYWIDVDHNKHYRFYLKMNENVIYSNSFYLE